MQAHSWLICCAIDALLPVAVGIVELASGRGPASRDLAPQETLKEDHATEHPFRFSLLAKVGFAQVDNSQCFA